MQDTTADRLFKFIIIGNSSSGKTCLLQQFLENKCTRIFHPFSQKELNLHSRSWIRLKNHQLQGSFYQTLSLGHCRPREVQVRRLNLLLRSCGSLGCVWHNKVIRFFWAFLAFSFLFTLVFDFTLFSRKNSKMQPSSFCARQSSLLAF
jgi:hypothetical protein